MNKALLILSAAATLFFVACDKDSPGTINDFSNSLPPYVDISSTGYVAGDTVDMEAGGDPFKYSFIIRTAIQQDVTVNYDIKGLIDMPAQTLTISKNTLKVNGSLDIPADVLGSADEGYVTVQITKATTADGQALTVGRYNDSTKADFVLRIANP